MSDYLHKLHKMKLFSLQYAAKVAGNESTAKSLLSAGLRNGTVCRIKKNLYAVTDLATMRCAASKYEIASHITETSCVAYHSAMEYHGLGHQLFSEVCVISGSLFRTFEFEGVTYVRHHPAITDGIVTPVINSAVRVTDLERTVIDCIDRIKYAGGMEELLNNLSSIAYIDEAGLLRYLDAYGKASLYQKAGFLLSAFRKQMRLSSGFFRHCRNHVGQSTRYLADMPGPSDYNAQWRLCVPRSMSNLLEQGGVHV